MLKITDYQVVGLEHAIRGMRNPMNSWNKSDSHYADRWEDGAIVGLDYLDYVVGPNDHALMMKLAKGGPVHAKYRRMIAVYVDIIAPLYWWKEFDTYKVGTVSNSCSTMHKIHAKEFTVEDFSVDSLFGDNGRPLPIMLYILEELNFSRDKFLETKDKKWWKRMIQLLPSSYNQKRTIMLNYEVLTNIYESRRNHKLDEWHVFCDWIESLPYAELIIGEGR